MTRLRSSPATGTGARHLGASWALAMLLAAHPLAAQIDVSGYALGVATRTGASSLLEEGSTLLARGRFMLVAGVDPVELDIAYEHIATHQTSDTQFSITTPGATGSGDWLGTDWEVWSSRSKRTRWRHRLDRLSLAHSAGPVEITVGRQAISWATALFLTPADPFAPFDPSDPFRVYRGGVDALRLQVFPGPFTELEAVVRPAETSLGTTTTALARAQTSVRGWAVGGWAGALHDEAAGAGFATGAIGATAVRAEASVRHDPAGGSTLRAVLGVDRLFTPAGKDLYLVVEVQYDGFGLDDTSKLPELILSKPFIRGEMQVIGRWSAAGQVSYQIHPLVGLDALALTNLHDGSTLVAPGVSWSATGALSVRAGVFAGLGAESELASAIESEYGAIPAIGYASLTWYF